MREAVAGCHAAGLPLILEPIVYALPEEAPDAFAAAFPALVVAAATRLQALGPDILKVQFPRDDRGDEADWCRQLDVACGPTPWVLLGGGGAPEVFTRDLRIACRAGASGFIAGRTLWTGIIGDDDETETWLRRVGVPLLHSLRDVAAERAPLARAHRRGRRAAARLVRLIQPPCARPRTSQAATRMSHCDADRAPDTVVISARRTVGRAIPEEIR